jgi:hypothetical protein
MNMLKKLRWLFSGFYLKNQLGIKEGLKSNSRE